MKTDFIVAGPDDFVSNQPYIRKCSRSVMRIIADFLVTDLQTVVVINV